MAEHLRPIENTSTERTRWDANQKKRGFIPGRLWSIRCALSGFLFVCRTQRNAWVHLAATAVVIAAGLWARLPAGEWCWIVAAIASVWIAELLNTSIELLCDALRPQFDPAIGRVKDIAAAAVLITALAAAIIGACIFWPHIVRSGTP